VVGLDTDEFLSYHWYGDDEPPSDCEYKKPLFAEKHTNWEECVQNFTEQLKIDEPRRFQLPTVGEGPSSVTIAEYLQQEIGPSAKDPRVCSMFPVLPMSGSEGSTSVGLPTTTTLPSPPAGFDKQDFFTQRFTQHGLKDNEMPGKGMVDVSRTSPTDYKHSRTHQIGPKPLCGDGNSVDKIHALVRANHYSGSLEHFLSRRKGESLRTKEEFDRRNAVQICGTITQIQGWLPEFIHQVGAEKARSLTAELLAWAKENDEKAAQGKREYPFFPSKEYVENYDMKECERIRRESLERNISANLCELEGVR
jgi:hypothetical protein